MGSLPLPKPDIAVLRRILLSTVELASVSLGVVLKRLQEMRCHLNNKSAPAQRTESGLQLNAN
jgi:hypothetical protein